MPHDPNIVRKILEPKAQSLEPVFHGCKNFPFATYVITSAVA